MALQCNKRSTAVGCMILQSIGGSWAPRTGISCMQQPVRQALGSEASSPALFPYAGRLELEGRQADMSRSHGRRDVPHPARRVGRAGQDGEAARAAIMTVSTGNVPTQIFIS